MSYQDDEEDEEINDAELMDISRAKIQTFESKDRKSATIRLSDENGLNDMKIYLLLNAKRIQMEIELGIMDEDGERH